MLRVIAVIYRIQGVKAAFSLEDAAGVDVLVGILLPSFCDSYSLVFIVHKILCHCQRPFEGFKRDRIPAVPLVEHIELAVVIKRHTIPKICIFRLIINLLHLFLPHFID